MYVFIYKVLDFPLHSLTKGLFLSDRSSVLRWCLALVSWPTDGTPLSSPFTLTLSHDTHTPNGWLQMLLFGFLRSLTCFDLDIFFLRPIILRKMIIRCCSCVFIYASCSDMLVGSSVVYFLNMAAGSHWTQCTFLLCGIKMIQIYVLSYVCICVQW